MLAVVPATLFRHGLEDLRGGAPPLLRSLAHVASVQLAPGLGQEVPAVIAVLLGSHGVMVWGRSRRCQTDTVPNIGLTPEQRAQVDEIATALDTTPTEFARSAILETVQLQRALTAEDRADVLAAAEAEGLSLTAFCRAAILDAARQPEPGPQIETGGVGFLAWLLAMLSARRRAGTNA